jgi:tetratricopeptide (TPR) repeat protein
LGIGTFHNNPHYVEYTRLLKELHLLAMRREADTAATEAIRDEMDLHWSELNDDEIARVKIMSADLRMIQGKETFRQVPEHERSLEWLGPRLQDAEARRDWDTMLTLLRNGPVFLSRDQLASIRGQCYDKLGHPDVALLFVEFAFKFAPQNVVYLVWVVDLLKLLNRTDEIVEYTNRLAASEEADSYELLQLANALYQTTKTMPEQQAYSIFRQILALVDLVLHRNETTENIEHSRFLEMPALVIKGECFSQLGDMINARVSYDRALEIAPEAGDLWALRGLSWFVSDLEEAASDFEQAILKNIRTVSPYLFLSYRVLNQGNWHRCLQLCQRAFALKPSRRARARLLSWSAIAQYQLGYSPEQVRRLFEIARSLDPIDEAIRRNYEIFEQSLEKKESPSRLTWQVEMTQEEMREPSFSLIAAQYCCSFAMSRFSERHPAHSPGKFWNVGTVPGVKLSDQIS